MDFMEGMALAHKYNRVSMGRLEAGERSRSQPTLAEVTRPEEPQQDEPRKRDVGAPPRLQEQDLTVTPCCASIGPVLCA